ncbi:rac GTPase-activating protein 1 isoform X1 [Ixodes scapularis]|uniref:rac GTPase-activating protein 1 isoform X1 n=1 Tax=Ixodes scapularis TaxID=6945 RepID=UPI001C38045B|nr:rac GTPase-activating protein 1 isoform X1 [Ixodes scapularis]XP_042148320.1 rac GTPase-activating protein 1 isoform X1 [Ixodes scapularis]XP_042148321.1 rac GTPase-activating protein 1 isoform X1 [Ixodes scapularis]XP_042148322.1 rac GTPase-activating protein 1 isoform X1 [Ixodes scapularis]
MAPGASKLSLAAQFDDFCRQSVRKSSIEAEFLAFVRNQEECRKQWHAAEVENARLRKELEALKGSHLELERSLAYTREVLEKEVQRRERSEEEKEAKLKQIDLIREFIMNDVELRDETMEKLPFLRPSNAHQASNLNRLNTIDESVGSVLSISHKSLDDSDHGGEGVRRSTRLRGKGSSGWGQLEDGVNARKRRSQGTQGGDEVDLKRANVVATTTVTVTDGQDFVATSRFFTQPASLVPNAPPPPCPVPAATTTPPIRTRADTPSTTPVDQQCCLGPSGVAPRRINSAGKLQSRVHDFVSKTVIRPEMCGPCCKRIKFYKTALKCMRCRSTCHPECRDQVPLPCVQVSQTPTQGGSHTYKGTVIADHVPPSAPMVPAIVVHCIQEVERRGLSEVGLYRVSGSEREVREIREQFLRGKGIPNLSKADIHAICSVLKDFLRSLRETLICKSVWRQFVKAAEMEPGNRVWATWQAVTQLPQPNRDTLAALVLHLQAVAESPEAKMPITNLARVFGPTVVGFSVQDIDLVPNIHLETEKQAQVMESILNVPAEYWKTYMDVESDDDLGTPELKPGPGSAILGPVHGSLGKKSGRAPQRFTPASRSKISLSAGATNPRSLPKGHSMGSRRIFFTSPALK